jgi:hypothetical protein
MGNILQRLEGLVLNTGLTLAMEFGPNWLQPIPSRLSAIFPELSSEELHACDAICRTAMTDGHAFIMQTLAKSAANKTPIPEQEVAAAFQQFLHEKYDWITSDNAKHLFSQGYYYAWKEGLI